MNTPKRTLFGSLAAAAVLATAFGSQAIAAPSQDDGAASSKVGMLGAMQRDLGLTKTQATDRLASEAKAAKADKTLEKALGADYAGSWYDAKAGTLVVAVTDASQAGTVKAQGAQVRTVERSAAELDGYMKDLNAKQASAPSTVAGWYVDPAANKVVIPAGDTAAAASFAKKAGVPTSAIEVERSAEQPKPLYQGGDAYYISNARCSIGFAVNGGFVTAGHCGSQGAATQNPSGTFAGSSFPGNDYAWVRSSATITGTVNNYSGGSVAVRGSQDAAVGSSICRSGSTTGWHCGTIQARNSTVNYSQGSVYGLIRTSVCAEPGDSGGSAITGNQAQGVTSGGSGNCSSGGTTYFQPVNEILSAYGLTLKTS